MARKKQIIPDYSRTTINGTEYYRTRVADADGKMISLYGKTRKELQRKKQEALREIEEAVFRKENPTVAEYCERWLLMQSAKVSRGTLRDYTLKMNKYIVRPLGEMYLSEVTADDVRLALVPVSKMSASVYSTVNMLFKCVFYSAERSRLIDYNPTAKISAKGGKEGTRKEALTDEQVGRLLDAIKGLPPYVFTMIALYSGMRREEILGLQWDCVFPDTQTPYIAVRRAWRSNHNRPEITAVLKSSAARRDIPIPACLADCLKEVKEESRSAYVIADSEGNPLSYSQFQRMWQYIRVLSTRERKYYRYVNGQRILHTVKPVLGKAAINKPEVIYSLDFDVTPHQLRHTYITNLVYASVDPKTVQYLAGHESSKMTMDIYARVKYNRPQELLRVVNEVFCQCVDCEKACAIPADVSSIS